MDDCRCEIVDGVTVGFVVGTFEVGLADGSTEGVNVGITVGLEEG